MKNLSKRSLDNLNSCHVDLQLVVKEAIKITDVDFIIIEGKRTPERQQMLFDTGKSKVNPKRYTPEVLITKGKHIVNEHRLVSWAFDFIAYAKGKTITYDKTHLAYLIGLFTSVGNRLLQNGKISHKIVSGADWNKNGIMKFDQHFTDMPHIQMNEI